MVVALVSATIAVGDVDVTAIDSVSLRPGHAVFWDGPRIQRSGLASSGKAPGLGFLGEHRCAPPIDREASTPTTHCVTYDIDIVRSGSRLRVALDHPSNEDGFGLALVSPDGTVVDRDSGELSGLPGTDVVGRWTLFSAEVFADEPTVGRWQAVVIANDVEDSTFRMRAKLERARSRPPATGRLLPNLVPIPPFEIGFSPCTASEAAAGATRCLRFAQGPANTGAGPLTLVFTDAGTPAQSASGDTTLVGTQYQRIRHADGTVETVAAGEFEFHVAHAHYHHSQTGQYELWRVTDPGEGTLVPAAVGPKHGFCMADFAIAEWEHFASEPRRRELDYFGRPNCATPFVNEMGLSAGWADVYVRELEGNMIDVADNDPGLYVIRATVNRSGDIREERTDDNEAYALIEICASDARVVVHRRGIGADPWHELRPVEDNRRAGTSDVDSCE